MKTDIYISIKDLFAECVRKAWIVIIGMLIFAALLGVYKYKKDVSSSKVVVQKEAEDIETELQALPKADYNAVINYVNFYNYVIQQEEYISNSVIMNIDPYSVNVATLQYYVDAADENAAEDVVVAYMSYIKNGALAQDIHELDNGVNIDDVQSLITCDAIGPVATNMTYIANNSNIINVNVYGASKKQCKALASNIKSCVETYNQTIAQYVPNSISVIKESYSTQSVNSLITNKTDKYTNLFNWNTKLTDEAKKLGDENLALAEKLISMNDKEVSEETEEVKTEAVHVSISKKFIVLGALIGIVLTVFGVLVIYIMDGKLKTVNELQMMYGIRTFGSIPMKRITVFDKLSDMIFYRGKGMINAKESGEIILSQVATLCTNSNVKDLVFVGNKNAEEAIVSIRLIEQLKKQGIKAEFIGDVSTSASAVSKLSINKKAIVVETARKSYYADIDRRIGEIKNQGVEILGSITVK